ncbi:O-antigen translocase [Chitinibacter tainanensis]|uniref:O-antigen translocase n=1 Tax=Chitinibacter tainanensis TaxID=230667 RepID=UPI0003FA2619|nr:O-antigen translocase [Chitinibacter tainanensis]
MNPFKVYLYFGASTLIKAASGLVIIKLLALNLGPEQFGLLGQMFAFVAIVSMFSGGGVTNGLIRELSANLDIETRKRKIGAAVRISVAVSGVVSFFLIFSSKYLATEILQRPDLYWAFLLLAVSHWFVGFNNLSQALFSSFHDVNSLVATNIVGALAGLLLFSILLLKFEFVGALTGAVCLPAISGLVAFFVWKYRAPSGFDKIAWQGSWEDINQLLSYSFVMLVAVVAVPLSQMVVRDNMGTEYGWATVGYWQGILKISDVYMQFLGVLLANYFLPRVSADIHYMGVVKELKKFLFPLWGFFFLAFLSVYLIRDELIILLFSTDFLPMRDYFFPQMLGDFFRVATSCFVYIALAKGEKILPIGAEIFQGLGIVFFSYSLSSVFHHHSPVYANVVTYGLLLIALFCFFVKSKK